MSGVESTLPEDCRRRFEVIEVIAAGGFGTVLRARQLGLERLVAIKVLHVEHLAQSELVQRFVNEARLTAAINHPGVVKIIDFGADTGAPWIAYEHVPGVSLRAWLERDRLRPDEALEATSQVAEALHAAHSANVLHRDVKPDNIIVVERGRYKLIDFGVGRFSRESEIVTRNGVLLGTPAYLAPEYIEGEPATAVTDVYALGVTLYELLTGSRPLEGDDVADTLRRHLTDVPAAPSRVVSGLSRDVDDLVLKALARDPRERHATAGAFAAEIARTLEKTKRTRAGAGAVPTMRVGRPVAEKRTLQTRARPPGWNRLVIALPIAFGLVLLLWGLSSPGNRPGTAAPTRPAPSPADSSTGAPRPADGASRERIHRDCRRRLADVYRSLTELLLSVPGRVTEDERHLGLVRESGPGAGRPRASGHQAGPSARIRACLDAYSSAIDDIDKNGLDGPVWLVAEEAASSLIQAIERYEPVPKPGSAAWRMLDRVEAPFSGSGDGAARRSDRCWQAASRFIRTQAKAVRTPGLRVATGRLESLLEADRTLGGWPEADRDGRDGTRVSPSLDATRAVLNARLRWLTRAVDQWTGIRSNPLLRDPTESARSLGQLTERLLSLGTVILGTRGLLDSRQPMRLTDFVSSYAKIFHEDSLSPLQRQRIATQVAQLAPWLSNVIVQEQGRRESMCRLLEGMARERRELEADPDVKRLRAILGCGPRQ